MKPKLQGIIPPVVTPLDGEGAVGVESLLRLINHLIDGGVHGLFILGTTGEGPSLGREQQRIMIKESARITRGRLPLLVGVSAASVEDAVELARYAAGAGADAVVATPPFYFTPTESEVIACYERLAGDAGLPVFVYNMPAMAKIHLSPALVARLAAIPGVAGYKDSSGDLIDFRETIRLLAERDDFPCFTGPEELLAESILMGGDGGVSGGANLNPGLFVAQYEAAREGNLERVRSLGDVIYRQRAL